VTFSKKRSTTQTGRAPHPVTLSAYIFCNLACNSALARGAEGVIVAEGGNSAGYTLFVKNGHVIYENSFFDRERDDITSNGCCLKAKSL
jgi:hypothetical protein